MACSKKNKILINRFFKDIGLFNVWREYISYWHNKYAKADGLNPYSPFSSNNKMDSVIADTYISKHIKQDIGIYFEPNLVFHFRMYIREKYPEYVSELENPGRLNNVADNYKIEGGKYLIKGIHY
jgi:hypothetical protein